MPIIAAYKPLRHVNVTNQNTFPKESERIKRNLQESKRIKMNQKESSKNHFEESNLSKSRYRKKKFDSRKYTLVYDCCKNLNNIT